MSSIGPQQSPSFWDSVYRPDQSTFERAAEKYFDYQPEIFIELPNTKEKQKTKDGKEVVIREHIFKEKDPAVSDASRAWNVCLRVCLIPVTIFFLGVKAYYRNKHVYQIDSWENYQANKATQNSVGANPSTVAQSVLQQNANVSAVEKSAEVKESDEKLKKRADTLIIFCKIVGRKQGVELFKDEKSFKSKSAQDQIKEMTEWLKKFADNVSETTILNFDPESEQVKRAPLSSDELTAWAKTEDLPAEISLFKHCEELNISNLPLKKFPSTLLQLTNLKDLYLANTQLSEIPEEIAKLGNLKRLDIDNNQISTLPDTFKFMHNLDMLVITNNKFTEFPDPLLHLPKLSYVAIAGNQLTQLPKTISAMDGLKSIIVGDKKVREKMKISELPDSIRIKIYGDDKYPYKEGINPNY